MRKQILSATLVLFGLIGLLVSLHGSAANADKIRVVASFSVLGDMVEVLGGERVDVVTLVGPDSDGHLYQPTPSDGRKISQSDLVVVNGLHFEGWITRLITSAGYTGPLVTATDGVNILYLTDEPDPHAWQSLANAGMYARNITSALQVLRPDYGDYFERRYEYYSREINALQEAAKRRFDGIPSHHRVVVTSHDAFGYFGREFTIRFLSPQGVSTDVEASATNVAQLIRQMKRENVRAVFVENIADARLVEQIARETGAVIGGSLYSDALSPASGPASTYLEMMRHNIDLIADALSATDSSQ
jgi:zinc/manganese transport system substrate-binding protein